MAPNSPKSKAATPPVTWVRVIIWVSAAAYGLLTAYILWRSAVLQPYSDMFDWVDRYLRFQISGDWFAYLLHPHNFHRLVWTFLILDLDANLFSASSYLFLAVGAACLGLCAALLAREAARAAPKGLTLPAGVFAAMVTLMAGNLLDASIDINTTYVHALTFALLAILLSETPGTPRARTQAAALICVFASALGNAVGFAALPVVLLLAWRRQTPPVRLLTLTLAGLAFAWLYFYGGPVRTSAVQAGPEDAARAVELFLNYLGLPWTRALPPLGALIGLFMFVAAIAGILTVRPRAATRSQALAAAFILFSLITAVMAALGRAGPEEPSNVPLRYAVFLAPLHVGLLIRALPIVAILRERSRAATDGLLALGAVVFVAHQMAAGVFAIRTTDVNRAMIADFRGGQRYPRMTQTVHPDLARAQAISNRMRRAGLYQREWHLKTAHSK
jgi:hypothetical protein